MPLLPFCVCNFTQIVPDDFLVFLTCDAYVATDRCTGFLFKTVSTRASKKAAFWTEYKETKASRLRKATLGAINQRSELENRQVLRRTVRFRNTTLKRASLRLLRYVLCETNRLASNGRFTLRFLLSGSTVSAYGTITPDALCCPFLKDRDLWRSVLLLTFCVRSCRTWRQWKTSFVPHVLQSSWFAPSTNVLQRCLLSAIREGLEEGFGNKSKSQCCICSLFMIRYTAFCGSMLQEAFLAALRGSS